MNKKPVSIAVINHKGGVGKTATVLGLASGLMLLKPDCKILIVDCDEQSSIKTVFGIKNVEAEGNLGSILINNTTPASNAVKIRDNLDVILSGGRKIREFENKMSQLPRSEEFLSERFKNIAGYDYILLDCPPALSLISSNVALFADYVLIPNAPDFLSLVATKATLSFLEELKILYGRSAKVLGVVPTMNDARRSMDLDIIRDIERMEEHGFLMGGKCFSEIRVDSKFKTAQVRRKLIHEVFAKSNSAIDYLKLSGQVVAKIAEIELNASDKERSTDLLNRSGKRKVDPSFELIQKSERVEDSLR
jgi:chromosome partitioning protein